MATAYIAYLTDMKAEVFLSPYKNLQWIATNYQEILVYTRLK